MGGKKKHNKAKSCKHTNETDEKSGELFNRKHGSRVRKSAGKDTRQKTKKKEREHGKKCIEGLSEKKMARLIGFTLRLGDENLNDHLL